MKDSEQEDEKSSPIWSRSKWICGWFLQLSYDKKGWWITDNKGYRNTIKIAYSVINDASGQEARRINLGNIMFEWAYPIIEH